ncbi:MAG TPA: uroporphyrinogen-III synthase, partial [Stellaceae bacterium]|nr:uroporphyrinogen-III synthase [Stellaceae bacterium]
EADPIAGLSVATAQGLREGSVDFALFFSPRTAAIFRDLAERAGLADALASVIALSISAAADAALATLGFRERHVAARPDQPSLLAALDRLIAERRRA